MAEFSHENQDIPGLDQLRKWAVENPSNINPAIKVVLDHNDPRGLKIFDGEVLNPSHESMFVLRSVANPGAVADTLREYLALTLKEDKAVAQERAAVAKKLQQLIEE